jgi:hypothetical protein
VELENFSSSEVESKMMPLGVKKGYLSLSPFCFQYAYYLDEQREDGDAGICTLDIDTSNNDFGAWQVPTDREQPGLLSVHA